MGLRGKTLRRRQADSESEEDEQESEEVRYVLLRQAWDWIPASATQRLLGIRPHRGWERCPGVAWV